MASKAFVDANVLLDLMLKRAGYGDAQAIVQKGIDGEIVLHTSPAVIHILGYWLTKAYSATKAKELILALLADITIIDCDHSTAQMALNSKIGDIEDALQYYTALLHKCDYFVSGDKKFKANAIPQLPICNAGEFLKEFDNTQSS